MTENQTGTETGNGDSLGESLDLLAEHALITDKHKITAGHLALQILSSAPPPAVMAAIMFLENALIERFGAAWIAEARRINSPLIQLYEMREFLSGIFGDALDQAAAKAKKARQRRNPIEEFMRAIGAVEVRVQAEDETEAEAPEESTETVAEPETGVDTLTNASAETPVETVSETTEPPETPEATV